MVTKADRVPAAVRLVAAFINTLEVDTGTDEIGTPERLLAWLKGQGLIQGREPLVGLADVAAARSTRESLRELLESNCGRDVPTEVVESLNDAADRARLHVSFDAVGSATLGPCADGVNGALGRIMAAVFTAMTDGTWCRLKPCRRSSCRWVFYDESKNQSGHWCSMRVCGNREKAARRRARSA